MQHETTFKPYTLFQQGNYIETVLQERNGVSLVDCSELGINKLYRIEWKEDSNTHACNEVRYTREEAIQAFLFHLLPIGTFIAVTFKAETVNTDETIQEGAITEHGTVVAINGDKVIIADELDFDGKLTIDSRILEFPFLSSHVEIVTTNLRYDDNPVHPTYDNMSDCSEY